MLNTIISSQDNNGAETPLTQLPIVEAITEEAKLPELPNELIEGVIRRGSKLLVTGASKSGKSFLFIELALAVATGGKWCGTQCAKGRVLYVNLEIQEPQFMRRVYEVMEKPGMVGNSIPRNFHIANLRGKFSDIKSLVNAILELLDARTYDLILIDPTYKVQSGSENSADAITAFCKELDRLVEGHGCTVAYTHHHSKGSQGNKNAEDRASGSGVFARDADTIIDMVQLSSDEEAAHSKFAIMHPTAVPFRLEFILRDFQKKPPVEIWFAHPLHVVDEDGELKRCNPRKAGSNSNAIKAKREALEKLEGKLDRFMGSRTEIDRKDFLAAHPMKRETFNKRIKKSERFEVESGNHTCKVRRIG